ncbi:unnamed protein product [Chrysoparadoxa australica]
MLWQEDVWDEEREREAQDILRSKPATLSKFWQNKYKKGCQRYWHQFYKRNRCNFYKDRHYLETVFPVLAETDEDRSNAERTKSLPSRGRHGRRTMVEMGCGVGNAVFPLLEVNSGLFIIALDLARSAIQLVKENPLYSLRCAAFTCDATADPLPELVSEDGGVDAVLLLFCLSAVAPEKQATVVRKAAAALKPGGAILFRDYGQYDEAQLRFGRNSKLQNDLYVRQDGTLAYYFSLDRIRELMVEEAGLVELECCNILRQYSNRQQQKARRRVWVHAQFVKPS